jgi:hypothetical protein
MRAIEHWVFLRGKRTYMRGRNMDLTTAQDKRRAGHGETLMARRYPTAARAKRDRN